MSDPIDDLLDQAASCAKKLLRRGDIDENGDDGNTAPEHGEVSSIFNFTYPNITSADDLLSGKHHLVVVRECVDKNGDSGNQCGMYAKCDIKAGTKLVISKPIVVCWDVEDEDDDDGDDESEDDVDVDENIELEAINNGVKIRAQVGSESSGEDDDSAGSCDYYIDENGEKVAVLESNPEQKMSKVDKNGSYENIAGEGNESYCDDDDDDDTSIQEEVTAGGTKRNGILILRAIEKIKQNPSLWTNTLSKLHPRDADMALLNLPPWFCGDASIGMEIDKQLSKLASLNLFSPGVDTNKKVCEDIALRLPLIVRYNVLSVETCSEQFVYPDVSKGGLADLAGTGLYGPEVSYFNHSCVPNVSRYCIGDVIFFVANRDVANGEELCFSYIEHEYLCENVEKRNALLDMDFQLNEKDDGKNGCGSIDDERSKKRQKVAKMPCASKEKDNHQSYPLIDAEMQTELMATLPMERLDLINELLDQRLEPVQDFQCDKYQLHILKAITLDGLGRTSSALPEWEAALDFTVKNFPTLDETTIALHVQVALCALEASRKEGDEIIDRVLKKKAEFHAGEAMKMHNLLFGGGIERFLKRYEKEFLCPLRLIPNDPATTCMNDVQELFSNS